MMQTKHKLSKPYGRLALRCSLWLLLARVSLTCWWAFGVKRFCLKLRTGGHRHQNGD